MTKFSNLIRQQPVVLIAFIIVCGFLIMAVFGQWIAPYDYAAQDTSSKLTPSSREHLLGTDQFGRDILSRIIVGSRDVGMIAGSSTIIAVMLGTLLGLSSGYIGGLLDEVLMRFLDVLVSIPVTLLAMVILGTVGPSRKNIVLVVGILFSGMIARVVRSSVLDLKTRQFVEAAKLRGETSLYITTREILPNVLPTIAVEGSMRFSYAIFLVASLGFLGLGIQPPNPDWGLMVSEARDWYAQAPWVLYTPAIAVAILVVSISIVSDALNKLLTPGGVSES